MTTTNEKPIPVEVPACFIKNKAVDYDGEVYAAMGASLPIGGFLVRPPSLGVFSLMETYESKFISEPEQCSIMEFWRVLYINEHRQACLQEVMEWAYPDKGASFDPTNQDTWQSFDHKVYNWGEGLKIGIHDDDFIDPYINTHKWFSLAFEGFEMIPGGGDGSEYWFGADSIGSLVSATKMPIDDVLWNVSMCTLGHTIAALCKHNGNEHIKRPKDKEDVKLQFELARQRIRDGVMHPWQIDEPLNHGLSSAQVEYNPKLIDEWEALVKEKKNSGK